MNNTETKNIEVGLAPMEGVTDFPVRLWFQLVSSPTFVGTPFLRLTEDFPKNNIPKTWCPEILDSSISEFIPYETVPQFMTPKPEYFVRSAKKILRHTGFVELNCGCPAPKAVGKGAGSSLLVDAKHFSQFIDLISGEVGAENFSIKIRSGYDSTDNHQEIIKGIENVPLKRLTIHGRTKAQAYKQKSDWNLIRDASNKLNISVYGSGDIVNSSSFEDKISLANNIDGLIIGRGALRNPWVFEEIRTKKTSNLPIEIASLAFGSLAVLHELYIYKYDSLIQLVKDGLLKQPAGKSVDRWQETFEILVRSLHGSKTKPSDIEISRGSLGKTKMIWSYFRSSLPSEFFQPKILRSKSLGEMFLRIEESAVEYEKKAGSRHIFLEWNSSHDWIYAGEKRDR